jgi:hypothetical protein
VGRRISSAPRLRIVRCSLGPSVATEHAAALVAALQQI